MNILHCVIDEKFIAGMMRLFDNDRRHYNSYVYVTNNSQQSTFLEGLGVKSLDFESFLQIACKNDVVILHSLSAIPLHVVTKIPTKCKVVWFAWGFDLYSGVKPIIKVKKYNNETMSFMRGQRKSLKKSLVNAYIYCYRSIYLERALSRIDYFSGVYPYEFELVKKTHKLFEASKLDFYYGDIDFFIKDTVDKHIVHNKKIILIGNSADPSNNHHDVLTLLKKVGIPQDSRIIMPLSYAGTPKYKEWIMRYADSLFPGQVNTLQSYLPFKEYNEIISGCKVAVFFHERQQASDNVFLQLKLGAKVYMSESCQAYHYLKGLGFIIFSLQKDLLTIWDELSDEDIINNRELLVRLYSESRIIKRIFDIDDLLSKDIK